MSHPPDPPPSAPADTPAPPPTHPAAPPARPRRRLWRRLWRRLGVLLALLALSLAAIQVLLRTDYPRRLALARLQEALGLRITAASLHTTWLGRTVLRDVTLTLPLADEAFLTVPRMEVEHVNLLGVVLPPVPMDVRRLELDRPRLVLLQDAQGQWNVQEAAALLGRALARDLAKRGPDTVPLPDVVLRDGTIALTDRQGRSFTLAPLQIHGQRVNPVAWDFSAALGSSLSATGRLAPQQQWAHRVEFSIHEAGELLQPWLPSASPTPLELSGQWTGRLRGNQLSGELELHQASIARYALSGRLDLEQHDQAVLVAPRSLVIRAPQALPTPLLVRSGALRLDATQVQAQSLDLGVMGGSVRLDGQFDWPRRNGSLKLAWTDLSLPGPAKHAGTLDAAFNGSWPDQPRIDARILSSGVSPAGRWTGQFTLAGQGQSWASIDWRLALTQANWEGKPRAVEVKDVIAQFKSELHRDRQVLELTSLRYSGAEQLRATGQYSFQDGAWRLEASARALPLPGTPAQAALRLKASGMGQQVDLPIFELRGGDIHLTGSGKYRPGQALPLQARLQIGRLPFAMQDPTHRLLARGGLAGEVEATGRLRPSPDVQLQGHLSGSNLMLGKRTVGDLRVEVVGHLDNQLAWLRTKELKLLDGQWSFRVSHRLEDRSTVAGLEVRDLPLKQVDGLLDRPQNLEGRLRADMNLHAIGLDFSKLNLGGTWQVEQFRRPPFLAEQIRGHLSLQDKTLVLGDITLRQGQGSASARLEMNLEELAKNKQLAVQFEAKDWPIEAPSLPVQAQVTASSPGLRVNTTQPSASSGPLALHKAQVSYQNRPVASVSAQATLGKGQLLVGDVKAEALEGVVRGQGKVDLADWTRSRGQLTLDQLDAQALARIWPAAAGLRGRFAGRIAATQPTDRHATAPLEIQLSLSPRQAEYNALSLGPLQATFLADKGRLLLQKSSVDLADGQARLWARLSKHEKEWTTLGIVDFENLKLEQIVQAVEPTAQPMVARLAGHIDLIGSPLRPRHFVATANVQLSQADLTNSDIVGGMQEALNRQGGPLIPRGEGSVEARLEEGVLTLRQAVYRNRGLEIRTAGFQVQDVFQRQQSPLRGYVVGTARPLRDLKLPFLADLDATLSVLQGAVTTLKVGGTIAQPSVTPAALSEIGTDLRDILIGQTQKK